MRNPAKIVPYLGALLFAYGLYDQWKQWQGGQPGYDMTGWTKVIDCGLPDIVGPFGQNTSICGPKTWGNYGQVNPYGTTPDYTCTFMTFGAVPNPFPATSWSGLMSSLWDLQGPDLLYPPTKLPLQQPWPQEWPWPAIDPFQLPPAVRPMPEPKPIPWRAIPHRGPHPDRSPGEQPQWGNEEPGKSPDLDRPPLPGIVFGPGPGIRPTPRPGGRPGADPPVKPPGRRTKERKFKTKGGELAFHTVMKAFHGLTEVKDFVDALYKALPKEFKNGEKSLEDKLRALYKHFDKVDVAKAIENVVKNEIEDRLWGQYYKLQDRAGRQLGERSGYKLDAAGRI